MRFCANCGKGIEKGSLCIDCRPAPEIKAKPLEIRYCIGCYKIHYHNKWSSTSIENAVKKHFKYEIIKIKSPKIQHKPGLNIDLPVILKHKKFEYEIPCKITTTTCPVCSKSTGNYYEGIIQIRNSDDDIKKYIKSFLKKNPGFESERESEKTGFNIRFTDKKKARNLAKSLISKFGGKLKESPHVHSYDKQTSKNIIRLNILYEAFRFKENDCIKQNNNVYKILSLGRTITALNLRNNQKETINPSDYQVLKTYKAKVSKIYPHIEVIHPKTFQSEPVKNKTDVKINEKVKIVIPDSIYIVN